MTAEAPFATHLERPLGRGHTPADAFTGAAGGAACGDLIRISLALGGEGPEGKGPHSLIADAGFDASGCGAALAAGSATVALVRGAPLLDAARVGAEQIAAALGGLLPAKQHAAELAADALHRALGAAARACGPLASPIDACGPLASPIDADAEGAGALGEAGRPATRTLVAMSGGVDSAVAALLTARRGEHVVGVTLELWADAENDADRSCCSAQAVRTARGLAHAQGFPHFSIDLREEFRAGVVDGWLEGYARGVTPNPCISCNGSVRLDAMLELATRLGAERLVTGHYARVVDGPMPLLRVARDKLKDQSYALAGLDPASLARLEFPLGDITKDEVREIAAQAGLSVARKPDSQDLCFLAGTNVRRFIGRHGEVAASPGSIVDVEGSRLGTHRGAHTFTVGQRHGLGLPGGSEPLFVLSTDVAANTVTVGPRAALMTDTVAVRDVILRAGAAGVDGVRVRSHGPLLPGRLTSDLGPGRHDGVEVSLREPVPRAAPGQIACLYEGDVILGYGTIAA